jgi:hypothetical protein
MFQFRHSHGYGQGTGRQDSLSDDGRQQHLLSENGQDRGGHPRTHSCCEPPSYITSISIQLRGIQSMDDMYNSRKSASQNARFVNLMRFPSQGTKHRSSFYWQVNTAKKYTAFGGDGNDRRRGCGNPYRPSCHGRNSIKVGEVHPQSHRRRILSSPTGLWRSQIAGTDSHTLTGAFSQMPTRSCTGYAERL